MENKREVRSVRVTDYVIADDGLEVAMLALPNGEQLISRRGRFWDAGAVRRNREVPYGQKMVRPLRHHAASRRS